MVLPCYLRHKRLPSTSSECRLDSVILKYHASQDNPRVRRYCGFRDWAPSEAPGLKFEGSPAGGFASNSVPIHCRPLREKIINRIACAESDWTHSGKLGRMIGTFNSGRSAAW